MENAFLQAITNDPDDLVSRQVYADWLSEQDDLLLRDRGEFLRIQFALAAAKVPGEERRRLLARQDELLTTYRQAWDESFRFLVRSYEYRNGFAERVTLDCEQFFSGFTDLIVRAPVVRVRLSGLTLNTAGDIATAEGLAHLRELVLEQEEVSGAALAALLRSPHLPRLRYLNLARNPLGDEGVRALIASNAFRQLRYLNLSHVGITRTGVRALVAAVALEQASALRWLFLHGAPRQEQVIEYPPLPATVPLRLRQSIEDQIGPRPAQRPDLLQELYATRTALPADLRRWVEWLQARDLARALAVLTLPDALYRAFAAVCQRRAVWRASRTRVVLLALPVDAKTKEVELAGAVTLLLRMTDPAKEETALTNCLLDLFLRHHRGELPVDGRTR